MKQREFEQRSRAEALEHQQRILDQQAETIKHQPVITTGGTGREPPGAAAPMTVPDSGPMPAELRTTPTTQPTTEELIDGKLQQIAALLSDNMNMALSRITTEFSGQVAMLSSSQRQHEEQVKNALVAKISSGHGPS